MKYYAYNKSGKIVAAPESVWNEPEDVLADALYIANQWNKDETRENMRVHAVRVAGFTHLVF